MDRRYNVVYELDPDKRLPMGDGNYTLTPEQAEKLRKYKEFLESLGEDPRKVTRREGTNNLGDRNRLSLFSASSRP